MMLLMPSLWISLISCSPARNSQLSFTSLSGFKMSESDLLRKGKVLFFTCGCGPCRRDAQFLKKFSQSITIVSDLPANRIVEFAARAGWNGEAIFDQAGLFMNKYGFSSCPSYAVGTGVGLRRLTFEEARAAAIEKQGRLR